ncbi:hypothetical protein NAP1_10098 [Erythrobacter sp. NAP1]|nr:hypothetical protein NAP1_10098 [Erythrobacter sp. NAP1]
MPRAALRKPARITALAARAAQDNPATLTVLMVSLALAIFLMSLAWVVPALYL